MNEECKVMSTDVDHIAFGISVIAWFLFLILGIMVGTAGYHFFGIAVIMIGFTQLITTFLTPAKMWWTIGLVVTASLMFITFCLMAQWRLL